MAWVDDFQRWFERQTLPESVRMGVGAVLVGLLGGASIWIFKKLIVWVQVLLYQQVLGRLPFPGGWVAALLPVLGGLLVGGLVYRFIGHERYHGLPGIMEACALAGGRLPYWKMPVRVLAAAISIGSGASVGPEDPSVQAGANIGSMIGQWLRLPEERVRALVAGGAAAGIAAAFNAPIAGVFFALEVLLGELSSASFGFAAIASVVSAIFTQAVSGTQPAFLIAPYAFHSLAELPFYLLLGLLAGPLAAIYTRAIPLAQQAFARLPLPDWGKPAVAGLLVGATGVFLPQILGVGYPMIEKTLSGAALPVGLLLAVLLAKLILTPVSIGGGFVGGVFAPSLFLGAMLGSACGTLFAAVFPGLGLLPPSFALVGMAAVLAGATHAPLTAVLLLFEMTQNYRIILPLMLTVAVSLFISRRLQHDSVYTGPLARNGIHLEHTREIEVLDQITVAEVMQPDCTALTEADTTQAALRLLVTTRRHGLPVLNPRGELVGLCALQDVDGLPPEDDRRVGDVCSRDLVTVTPEDSLSTALQRMGSRDIGRLPVVDRHNPLKLLGMLRRSDVIRAHEIALARRTALRHRLQEARLGMLSGAQVQEVLVQSGSACDGQAVQAVAWPRSVLVSSVRRGSALILPHGDTILAAGDVLLIICESEGCLAVERLCAAVAE